MQVILIQTLCALVYKILAPLWAVIVSDLRCSAWWTSNRAGVFAPTLFPAFLKPQRQQPDTKASRMVAVPQGSCLELNRTWYLRRNGAGVPTKITW